MARRPFDSNYSRRPTASGGSGGSQYSLLGEPTGLTSLVSRGEEGRSYGQRGSTGGGGGAGGYDDDYAHERYGSSQSGGGEYEDAYEEKYEPRKEHYDRIPRDGNQRSKNDYGGSGGGASGGWRQRSPSPSPRFSSRSQDSERVPRTRTTLQQEPEWTPRDQQQSTMRDSHNVFEDRRRLETLELELQQQQFQAQNNPFVNALQNNNAASVLRNPLGSNAGLLGQHDQSVVMVLPHGQATGAAGGLMGSMGMVQAGNPFGVIGQQKPMQVILGNLPSFNPSPFGQQILQQAPVYGQGIGQQQPNLNIYGPQTQQGFNRFEISQPQQHRSGSSGDNRRSSLRNNERSSAGGRRSDSRTPAGSNKASTGPVAGRNNNDPSSRKRNLVLRDPRPDEIGASDRKRPRTSKTRGGRGKGNNKGNLTQVKRITLGEEKHVKDNRYKRKSDLGKDKKVSESGTSGIKKEGTEQAASTGEGKGHQNAKNDRKEKDKDRKTKYDEFPTSILVCKVCQKVMNDGASFESHLSGRAHVSLMKILEERFTKRSELLMIESKCAEEEIGIEMERQRRAGKGGRPEKNMNNYCKMCDCNYVVNWGTHKVSLGHRVLKEFLHPTCRFCKAHFMHRIEWVTHLQSHSHLQRINELKAEGTIQLGEQESPSQDELFAINMELSRDERPTNAITIRSLDGKESLTEEMKEILKNDRGEIVLPTGEIPIPEKYDENVEIGVGADAIVAVSGSRCRVCRVYIADDKDVEGHCKTKEHFHMYVSFLKRVVRHREHKEEERKATEEKAKKEEEKKQKDAERAAKKKANEQIAEEKAKVENGGDSASDKPTDKESEMEVDESIKDKEHAIKTEEKLETGEKDEEKTDENDVVLLDEVGDEEEEKAEQIDKDEEPEEEAEADADLEEEVIEEQEQNGDVEMTEAVTENGTAAIEIPETEVDPKSNAQVETIPSKNSEGAIKDQADSGAEIAEKTVESSEVTLLDSEEIQVIEDEDKVMAEDSGPQSEEDKEEKAKPVEIEIVDETPVTPTKAAAPAKATSPQIATRGGAKGGRGGFIRGTPARGRGTAQALKNVTPRVDSNLRGGSSARGQARGGRASRGVSPHRRGSRGRGGR